MSEADKAVVENKIREEWVGEFLIPLRGYVRVNKVRDGGLTDLLIKKACAASDAHYRKVIRDIINDPTKSVHRHTEELRVWVDER